MVAETPWSGQFTIIDGVAQERGPWIAVSQEASWETKGALYILAECTNPQVSEASRLVLQTLHREFRESSGSVTNRLLSAFRTAHQRLIEANRRSLPERRAGIGATCVYLKEDDLYFAQAGPASVHLLRDGQLYRMDSWHTPGRDGAGWLGLDEFLEITPNNLSHSPVKGVSSVLLSFYGLQERLNESKLLAILSEAPDEALRQLYLATHHEPFFATLLIRPPQRVPGPARVPVASRAAPATGRNAARSEPASTPLPQTQPPAGNGTFYQPLREKRRTHKKRQPLSSAFLKDKASQVAEQLALPLTTSPLAEGVDQAKDAIATAANDWLPRLIRYGLIALATSLAVVLVGALLFILPRFVDERTQERFAAALQQAQATHQRALTAPNRGASRELLIEAQRQADEALSIRGDDDAKQLKERIAADLREVNAVRKLLDVRMVADLANLEGGVGRISRVVWGGNSLYLLDEGRGRVYSLPPQGPQSSGITVLARHGQSFGNTTFNNPLDVIWMPPGGTRSSSDLLVIDDKLQLLALTKPGEGHPLAVRGTSSWSSFKRAIGFSGNLYVLDPAANQVWRYFPTDTGYDSEPRGILEATDLSGAVDLAVDGAFYVLLGDGTVRRFVSGRSEGFEQLGIDKPLSNPTAIYTSENAKNVYVADRGNKRIVVYNKQGEFLRQLMADQIESPAALYVDEANDKLYLVSRNRLYSATIPKG